MVAPKKRDPTVNMAERNVNWSPWCFPFNVAQEVNTMDSWDVLQRGSESRFKSFMGIKGTQSIGTLEGVASYGFAEEKLQLSDAFSSLTTWNARSASVA